MPKHIHFLGIAGIGVSALAQLAQAQGIRVSGSDPNAHPDKNPAIARLQAGGATLYTTHQAENIAPDVDLVVASAAVGHVNPELQAARERGIAIVSRAEFLGQLMAAHKGPKIAVAGTHGKTTTTGMIGVMLQHAGLDPTVFVGGEVPELGGNVRVGSQNGPFVAEACEAYDSFLYLKPDIAIITNIEADHLDHYGTAEGVTQAFRRFLQNVNPEGDIIVCADDPVLDSMHDEICDLMSYLQYGITDAGSGTRADKIVLYPTPSFDWVSGNHFQRRVTLSVPGRHNVLNALAALALTNSLWERFHISVPLAAACKGLNEFRGATRRQDLLGEGKRNPNDLETIVVMDDYAHHPTEIRATLDALCGAYPARRLVAIFQPHLYSRTRDFLEQFAESLALADVLLVTDIYAARETPLEGIRAEDIIAKAIEYKPDLPASFVQDKNALPANLAKIVRPGDVCVFMGAGDIREQGERFVQMLSEL